MFTKFFGRKPPVDISALLAQGAVIVDVRSPAEFAIGHAPGARNVPLDELPQRLEELRALPGPLLLCCASGLRSARAQQWLSEHGVACHNVGSWADVSR
jgi:rhodanese-related sulfurtransferase